MLVESGSQKRSRSNHEIAQFIGNLKQRTDVLDVWANEKETNLCGEGFETYLEFRDLVIECESFSEIIKRRLQSSGLEGVDEALQEQLDQLTVRQLSLAIRASLKFLRHISEKSLPIGSRDVFIRELHDLHRMKKSLENERFKERVDPEALKEQEKVEEILKVVIEKAPQLFSFDNFS